MPARSWWRRLLRATGSLPRGSAPEGKRASFSPRTGQSLPPLAPVLKEALRGAVLTQRQQAALEEYRLAVRQVEGAGEPQQKAALLGEAQTVLERLELPQSLGAVMLILRELFQDCADIFWRGLKIGGERRALLLFAEGISSTERIELAVLKPLGGSPPPDPQEMLSGDLIAWLQTMAVSVSQVEQLDSVGCVVDSVLNGDAVLLVDGFARGLALSVRDWEHRPIEEPPSESIIRGPREGFNETLGTGTALLRRKLKSPQFKLEMLTLGRRTRTAVAIAYLKDVANPGIVDEVRSRLQRIVVDGVLDTGMIEELIEDQPTSLFPQMFNTERPDRVVAGLLEGQVAIMADGSPFALLAPVTFWHFLQTGEDYYERFWISTFLRALRFFFLNVAMIGPALYIAITTFHQEMIPTSLLLSIASAREGIPFPAMVEALLMELFFEGLREAGLRLPRPVGQAVSIVGALVIGQAAVQAGLASAPVVIIVAATGIASFTIPTFSMGIAVRLFRFPLMILSGTLGIFGVVVGLVAMLVHLSALRSFGTPYLEPVAPLNWSDLKNVVFRVPLWFKGHRPESMETLDLQRQASRLRPGPGGGSG